MVDVLYAAHPQQPGLDTGISHAIVTAVGEGRLGETFRLHRTTRIVAFGRQDRVASGYRQAVAAARAAGYVPIERLAGGRAAVFGEGTLAFSWAIPAPEPRAAITERFQAVSALMRDAFTGLGLDAHIGELPGEYCPGAYSVNIGGVAKVMGVGQRLVRGAAHVGGVIVVDGGRRIAEVLSPVYRALGLAWDPRTSGDLQDSLPDVTLQVVTEAVVARLAERTWVDFPPLPGWLVEEGRRLASGHHPAV